MERKRVVQWVCLAGGLVILLGFALISRNDHASKKYFSFQCKNYARNPASHFMKPEAEQTGSSESDENQSKAKEPELVFEVKTLEDIQEKAAALVKFIYDNFDDMNFSDARPAETIFVKDSHPTEQKAGYYIIALRNSNGELMARSIMKNISASNGKQQMIEAGNIEPFSPAYTDPQDQKIFRRKDKFPLTKPLPLISADKAAEIVRQRFPDTVLLSPELTNLYVHSQYLDDYLPIGNQFAPYYQFSFADGQMIWVNCETGKIINTAHLQAEVQRFDQEMQADKQDEARITNDN